ncbi:hypothetical protein MMC07_000403 [Pseudocyphellaria aurata]|nr:hypothetical protein [Pseudocyphellaria aurata]
MQQLPSPLSSSMHACLQVDNRMRAWYLPNMSLGLLYTCTLGDIKPDCPVALVSNHNHDGADFMEVIPTENQVPAQRDQVRATCAQAVKCWWSENHEGWMIFTLGNRHFQTLEEIIQYSQTEGAAVNAPMAPAMDAPMYAAPPRSKRHMPEDGNTGSGGSSDDPNKQHAHPDGIAIYGQQPTGGYRQPNDNDRSMAGQWGRDEPMAGHRGPTGMQASHHYDLQSGRTAGIHDG